MNRLTMLPLGLAALSLAACTTGTSPAEPGGGEPADDRSVALVPGTSGSPFYEALICGAQASAEELDLDLEVSAADQFAADAQIPVINAVTASGPSVAVVVPTDAQALVQPLRELTGRGAQLITVDQTLADTSIVATQILTDNVEGGRLAAEEVNTLTGGTGKVLVITQPPGSTAQDQRTQGFEEQLATYPGLQYLGAQYQSNQPEVAAQIITATLAANPDLAAVFVTNDQGAIGAVTGLEQAGAIGRVKVVAYDAATAEVAALKNGSIQALIAQNPRQEGEVAMQNAAALIDGKEIEPEVLTELVVIRQGEDAKADQYEYKAGC